MIRLQEGRLSACLGGLGLRIGAQLEDGPVQIRILAFTHTTFEHRSEVAKEDFMSFKLEF